MTQATLYPTALSGQSDGVSFSANPATIVIGTDAPNEHGFLRFDTSPIPEAETIVQSDFSVKLQAKGAGSPPDIAVWGSDFGAAIAIADYNQAENLEPADLSAYRAFLTRILLGSNSVGDVGTITIPTQIIRKGVGGVCDLELRPYVGDYSTGSTGATDSMTIHGPAAVSNDDKPKLVLTSLTDAELAVENNYRFPGVGAEAYLGFERETTRGEPVKAKYLVDLLSSDLDSDALTIIGQSMRRERAAPVKIALGAAGAQGGFAAEATPEKCWKLLLSAMKITATASLGSQTGSDGNSYTVYEHTFKVATSAEIATFTFVQKGAESYRFVYPGCIIDSFAISNGLDRSVDIAVSLMARDEWTYDEASAGEDDEYVLDANNGYDLNTQLSFVGVEIEKGSIVTDGTIQSFNFTLNNNGRARRGLRRHRGVRSHYVQKLMASIDYTMEFENELEMRKFLGIRHRDFPYKAEMSVQFDTLKVKMAGPLGEDVQEVTIEMPKMMYTVIRKPISGPEIVVLQCSAMATFSSSDSTNLIMKVKSTEAASAFEASTNKITVRPIAR
jgi:hypothetical protein